MATTPNEYICKNTDGECDYAVSIPKQRFIIRQGEELVCPNCKKRDIERVTSGKDKDGTDWVKIAKIGVPILLVLLAIAYFAGLFTPAPKCNGWECDGTYVAISDTSVTIFNDVKKLNKNDTLIVKDKVATIKPFEKHQMPPNPSPVPPPSPLGDTVNHFTGYFYKPPVTFIDNDNSKEKAIVEMGATGFDYSIIRVNPKNQWELVKYKPGWSSAFEGDAKVEDILPKLRDYIAEIRNYSVKPKYIYFIISSGAREQKGVPEIIAALGDLGYNVNVATPDQEAKYALKCALPDLFKGKAFVVDIGSSNTKIAWEENGKVSTTVSYGSKYRQVSVRDSAVYNDIVKSLRDMPDACKANCFIIGGVPYQLANLSRSGDERYTILKSPNAYNPHGNDKLIAGLNIYKAIGYSTACNKFAFDWSSHFGIGYLLSLKY